MNRKSLFLFCLLGLTLVRAGGVEVLVDGGPGSMINTDAPTSADIPNWDIGWGESGITGWDYLGYINGGDSAVYLGNNWVMTEGHVGPGNFDLGANTYDYVPGSVQDIVSASGTADLILFRIAQAPDLPALNIESAAPTPLSASQSGDLVAMLGNGGAKSWALNTVTAIGVPEMIGGYSYVTTDFETACGTTTAGSNSATNAGVLITGDSGGPDFIYDSVTGTWMLAGINEKIDDNNDSYMVQLSSYSTQINKVVSVPEPRSPLLGVLAFTALILPWHSFRRRPDPGR